MTRRAFTLILPYYENPGMLAIQLRELADLPEEVAGHISLIVVDDGSPKDPAEGVMRATPVEVLGKLATVELYRIEVDVRWNWLAARNIGVDKSPNEWVLMTDMDHTVPEATARRIQERKLDSRNAYRFSRVDAPDLTPYKPHPNSWLLTTDRMDKIGGYDERFSGFYGTDGEFRDRVRANSREIVLLDEVLVRWPREVQADASTTQYGRKEKQDHEGVTRVRAEIARQGGRPKRLSFPFHRVDL